MSLDFGSNISPKVKSRVTYFMKPELSKFSVHSDFELGRATWQSTGDSPTWINLRLESWFQG